MKTSKSKSVFPLADPESRKLRICCLLSTVSLLFVICLIGNAFMATDYKESLTELEMIDTVQITESITESITCKDQCRPYGSESLPNGIVSSTSNLEMQPLVGSPKKKNNAKHSMSLLAIAVGVKQKETVNKLVKKFPSTDFVVMLFHYDGIMDEWRDLEWTHQAIHVSAINQTKWWFAKRFLHPDIVAEYDYIFLWDEDLGVKEFHPGRYLSIVKDEGLEISQPALDPAKSEVHHQITARGRRSKVHRRIYKSGKRSCDGKSTAPPCTGWVEMMAPVFSRAAWRCTWYMIQNDLIHAWGLDLQLGYCAQGDRTKNVGVVDSEYIVHQGLVTLGAMDETKTAFQEPGQASQTKHVLNPGVQARSTFHVNSGRYAVRRRSYSELKIFQDRWKSAVREDKCWIDPYQ